MVIMDTFKFMNQAGVKGIQWVIVIKYQLFAIQVNFLAFCVKDEIFMQKTGSIH